MTQTSAFFLKRAAISLTVPLGLTRAICLAIDSLGSVGAVIACSTDAKRESIRSEEHTSELQSLMRISYAVFCLKKKIQTTMKEKQNNKNDKKQINNKPNES